MKKTHKNFDSLCSGNLINRFKETEVVLDRVAQLSAFESCAATVHNHDNVLEATCHIFVPITTEAMVYQLAAWATIPAFVSSDGSFRRVHHVQGDAM